MRWLKWHKVLRWPTGEEYLRRWMLTPEILGRKWPIRLYYHAIVRRDFGRHPHDHPASFLTWIISGGYWEAIYDDRGQYVETAWRGPGLYWRRAEHVHQVVSVRPNTRTLSLWGPYRRQWGFWVNGQFVPEHDYPRTKEQLQ